MISTHSNISVFTEILIYQRGIVKRFGKRGFPLFMMDDIPQVEHEKQKR